MRHHFIKNRQLGSDDWLMVSALPEDMADLELPSAATIYALPVWQHRRADIVSHVTAQQLPLGLWLAASDDVAVIADDLTQLAVVALDFPKFSDGRNLSSARLLRERYAYRGEIRAVGDVLVDQLYFMARCGFDAFCLRADQPTDAALAAFATFSQHYQGAADDALPYFRRRPAA